MAEASGISWTDHSFAPWHGCTKVSTGALGACEGCYAEHLDDTRFHRVRFGDHPRVKSAGSTWRQPLAWDRKAAKAGESRFVFCSHLSDVFDNQVNPAWRAELFDLIRRTPHLTWLLLTKRPQNILRMVEEIYYTGARHADLSDCWPRNAAIGCTAVTQAEADRDVWALLTAAEKLRPALSFVSCEPLMGPIDLTRLVKGSWVLNGFSGVAASPHTHNKHWLQPLGWVISGGETDQGKHKARPTHPDWERALRDQCAAVGVPYHRKQAGEWVAEDQFPGASWLTCEERVWPDGGSSWRVGKKRAGRLLDGVLHDARPGVRGLARVA